MPNEFGVELSSEEETEIAALMTELTTALSETTKRLTSLREDVQGIQLRAAEFAQTHNDLLNSQIAEMAESASLIKQIEEEAHELNGTLNFLQDTLDQIEASAIEIVSPIESESITAVEIINAEIQETEELIEGVIAEQKDLIDSGLLHTAHEFRDTISGTLLQSIQEAVHGLGHTISEQIRGELQPSVDHIAHEIETFLEGIVNDLAHGDAETRRENAAVHVAIDALRPAIDALLAQFDRVSALAHTVGI
jgi:hypothetical protein